MSKKVSLVICAAIVLLGVTASAKPAHAQAKRKPGVYATMVTDQGTMVFELFEKEAPVTVANFIGLAEGTKEYKDPKTGAMKKGPYYNGVIFHRVIPGFMIQGGDPTGTGMGDPGYKFKNEVAPGINFDKEGRLAMANAGRDTNGSQFFITDAPVGLSANDYTIFGQVIEGMDVVKKIARVPAGPKSAKDPEGSRPVKPPVIQKITIERVPAK